jgi:cell division protein FtsQ
MMALFKTKDSNKKGGKVRGASSRQLKPSRSFDTKKLQRMLSLICVLVVFGGIYQGFSVLLSQPVTRVVVNGEFLYVDKVLLVKEVTPFLHDGFIQVDLEAVRKKLVEQSWVFDVAVTREWPGEIVITVTEQAPIAYWGEGSYLNFRGELFRPDKREANSRGLPVLDGPKNSSPKVMNHFRQLNKSLAVQDLKLYKLVLDDRGNWLALLENNIQIVLGQGEVMEKIRRLLFAYELGLAADFDRIKSIDMRYNNGFSVGWHKQLSLDNNKNRLSSGIGTKG